MFLQLDFSGHNSTAQLAHESGSVLIFHMISKRQPADEFPLTRSAPMILVGELVNAQMIPTFARFIAQIAHFDPTGKTVKVLNMVVQSLLLLG